MAYWHAHRPGELAVVEYSHTLEPLRALRVNDISFPGHGSWTSWRTGTELALNLRVSKTDQGGRGKCRRSPSMPTAAYSPIDMMRAMMRRRIASGPVRGTDHLLARDDGTPLSYGDFRAELDRALTAANIYPRDFAPGSFRRGIITDSVASGVQSGLMGLIAGHASDIWRRAYESNDASVRSSIMTHVWSTLHSINNNNNLSGAQGALGVKRWDLAGV